MASLKIHTNFDDHERVLVLADEATGLTGIICIHSTALGPAVEVAVRPHMTRRKRRSPMRRGGIINVMAEYLGESANKVNARVLAIGERATDLLSQARAQRRPPNEVADELARALIERRSSRFARESRPCPGLSRIYEAGLGR